MKILLVSPESGDNEHIKQTSREIGCPDPVIFHYVHPLKAIDNLEEIQPDVIFWSYTDFPRHWKLLLAYSADDVTRKALRLILFSSNHIDEKEVDKAKHLGAAGIIQQGLDSPEALDVSREVCADLPGHSQDGQDVSEVALTDQPASPANIADILNSYRLTPDGQEISLLMTNPLSLKLIRGQVVALDPDSIEFIPRNDNDMQSLPDGTLLKGSRLKAGEYRLELDLRVQQGDSFIDLIVEHPERQYLPFLNEMLGRR